MTKSDQFQSLFISGEELYEMAKQRNNWNGVPEGEPEIYRFTEDTSDEPISYDGLEAPLDETVRRVERSVSELLDRDYHVTNIESNTHGDKDWSSHTINFRSDGQKLWYKVNPVGYQMSSVRSKEDLTEVDLEVTISGDDIGEPIWENTPADMRPEYFEEDHSSAEARWTIS